MEKKIVKYSITGLLKTISGNIKPKDDNFSLQQSLGFDKIKLTRLVELIEQNFSLNLRHKAIPLTVSLNQLVDIVSWEVQKNLTLERA